MRQFLPKRANHLFLSLGCSPGQAGPNSSCFPLWQQTVSQSLHPGSTSTNSELIQVNTSEGAAVAWRSPPTPPPPRASTKPGKGKCQSLCSAPGLGPRAGLNASCCLLFCRKRPSRLLFPPLHPQAHFCGVKSHFPVLRMLHFPLLQFESPTKTKGQNN